MRLVNTYLSKQKIKQHNIELIYSLFMNQYTDKIEVQSFKYDDRKYYETDFDIIGIEFSKNKIYKELIS